MCSKIENCIFYYPILKNWVFDFGHKKELYKKNSEKPENQKLSKTIKSKLEYLDKSQTWLAEQTGIANQSINLYAQGKVIPSTNNLEKIFLILEINTKSLDDL